MRTGSLYDWLKVLHLVALIAWMAGMLYLPRLFVYHADSPRFSLQSETFKVMERRLLKAIMNPAMIATWAFGIALAVEGGWWRQGWLHAKLALVLLLSGVHGMLAATVRRFAADADRRPARFYRILNEVPTALLILIVILVVLKPF
jgi:putative membrane protein